MGCVASKQAVSVTPAVDHSGVFRDEFGSGRTRVESSGLGLDFDLKKVKRRADSVLSAGCEFAAESGRASSIGYGSESVSFRLGNLHKYVEGEQVAAGWPAWLSAVAGEAIQGWVPLRTESFEKLEKIGQGTYSTVFRARDLESGRIVALKKVRFDNFEPESVRFMAREIMILRKLDHPNIIKLEGIITSRLSCSIYLVFEYMEHDVSGLLACPDVNFTESQVKCYMKQLLSGLEHCHSRGVMHRDIKGANLLVNNEGILKIGDFGLANYCYPTRRHPLTSRVVTLWYRPPELLLGSTDYGASVDIWSVGCVFGEFLTGKPILQGRTEVEQLHKIFKLCGSPPDDYWKKSKLPHATLFKPQHPYESCLWETFSDLPKAAVSLIESLLMVEPNNRGTASSALGSEYFMTKPRACDPSSLPKYPPCKEIDAKHRDEVRRKRHSGRARGPETTRKPTRKQNGINKLAHEEKLSAPTHGVDRSRHRSVCKYREGEGGKGPQPLIDVMEEVSLAKNASEADIPFSGPLQLSESSGFSWAKRRSKDSSVRSPSSRSSSKIFEPSVALLPPRSDSLESRRRDNWELRNGGSRTDSKDQNSYENAKRTALEQWSLSGRPESFDASDRGYQSQELSLALYLKEEMALKRLNAVHDHGDKVDFSGPLLSQTHRVDELLKKHERHIRQAVHRSWFRKVRRNGK
ncbi:unnamed protein product [Cuscuta campestris]|uniref:Protein kinase domain-containing protein n=1 Tax=Cuscuta campestris TaxID=132261 RepID=A0A484LJ81_9ASTE|nr:unnamed protein product [Cuscuta campestris]